MLANNMSTIKVDGQDVKLDPDFTPANSYDEDSMSFVQTNESGFDEQVEDNLLETNQQKLEKFIQLSS